jgi:hypothetical protein
MLHTRLGIICSPCIVWMPASLSFCMPEPTQFTKMMIKHVEPCRSAINSVMACA